MVYSVLIVPSWPSSAAYDLDDLPVLLLRGVTLADGRVADVMTAGGKVVAVTEVRAGCPAAEVLNLRGYLLLPSFAEPHAYLGRALTRQDRCGRAWGAFINYLVNGTTAIRAHVDVTEAQGLEALQVLVDVRTSLEGVMDIQLVAVTPPPVTGRGGARHRGALRYALSAGADLAGGAPAADDQPERAVECLAATAADAGAGLDLCVGAMPDRAAHTLSRLAVIVEAGFGKPVTASRVASLALSSARGPAFLRSLARAGIGAVTVPGAGPVAPEPGTDPAQGVADLHDLLGSGVTVAAGGGGQRDLAGPLGRADPLLTASLLAAAYRLSVPDALTAVTSAGRQVMRLPDAVIAPGFPADLVAVRAASPRQAMASRTPDRIVLRGGRVVARARAGTGCALPEYHAMNPVWN
jgi:cytosine/creatinine deaminase